MCPAAYKNKQELKRHKIKQHGVQFINECEECGQILKTSRSLKQHILKIHRTCGNCKKEFESSSAVEEHVRNMHDDENSFTCSSCNKTLTTKKSLNLHIKKIHNTCKNRTCKQEFINEIDRNEHMKNEDFQYESKLKRHIEQKHGRQDRW